MADFVLWECSSDWDMQKTWFSEFPASRKEHMAEDHDVQGDYFT